MSEQTVKGMQQALGMLEKGGLNCEQEKFVAQSLRQAIADYEQAETQEPVRRLSEDELNEFVDNIAAARKMVSFKDVMIMTMDACGIKGGEL